MTTRWAAIRRAASKARETFAEHINQPLAQVESWVHVREMAEIVYQLDPYPDGYLAPGINAVLDPAGQSIRVRAGVSEVEARFLIAHELGHADLEGLGELIEDGPQHVSTNVTGLFATEQGVLRGYNTRERREQEANLFALELLVPAVDLWNQLQQDDWDISNLASRYGVTPDAIRSQLLNVVCLYPPQLESLSHKDRAANTPFVLHENQARAVAVSTPTLVIAGPGTGKTRCMVERYIAMLRQGTPPQHILVLTFSNKAAEELRERIQAALPTAYADQVGNIHIYTFHAFGLELLRRYYTRLDLPATVPLLTQGELFILLKQHLDDLPLDHFKSLRNPGQNLAGLIKEVSRAKDELVTPQHYVELVTEEERAEQPLIAGLLGHKRADERKKGADRQKRLAKLREVAQFYAAYEQILRNIGAVDYGDLIMRSVELLHDPVIAAEIRQEFHYVMVDEFQDINYASGELVYHIDGGRQQVWVVGDPCQGIYGFRGASYMHITSFSERYPQTQKVHLNRNYRSIRGVLHVSDAQIAQAAAAQSRPAMHPQRRLFSTHPDAVEFVTRTEREELQLIAHLVHRLTNRRFHYRRRNKPLVARRRLPHIPAVRHHHFGDIAMLCRTRQQAAAVSTILQEHNIPVDYNGNLLDQTVCKDLLALCTLVRKGDRSGLLRILKMKDHRLSQADIDCLQRAAVTTPGGLYRILTHIETIQDLSIEGYTTLKNLRAIIKDLNQHTTAWHMLTHYLFSYSSAFRTTITQATMGSRRHRRTLQQIGVLLLAARNLTKPSLVLNDSSPVGFIRYIRELVEAGEANQWEDVETDPSAVKVMTVHRSKGLEFPVVIVPFLAEGQFPKNTQHSKPIPRLSRMIHGEPRDALEEERYA